MNSNQIKELADRVREAALSPERGFYGLHESKDSVNKKLIFLVPFSEVDKISGLIQHFENNFPELLIDVELNSLEDAYLKLVSGELNLTKKTTTEDISNQT
jgi:cobalamin biosynthesis Co2+ chelatase CbiK